MEALNARFRLSTAVLLAAISTAALAALAAASPNVALAPAASIVFTSDRGEGNHLHVVSSNGTGRRELTSGSAFDLAPAWSPAKKRVAFASTRQSGTVAAQDLFVVNADGTGLRALVETKRDESAPSWSPDGRSIVFSRDSTGTGHYDLYVVDVGSGKVRRLTASKAIEGVPAWSPNGRWIAYSRNGEIWLIRSDGTRAHGLGKVGAGVDWAPDWAPDSSRIAFESSSRTSSSRPVAQIWVMRSDGSRKQRLTPYVRRHPIESVGASWSPSGRQIVFTRGAQLWTMRADGSRVRQLTRQPGSAWGGDW
jgi:Tol biopolymer transport system component